MNREMHEVYALLYSDYAETPFSPDLRRPFRGRFPPDGVLTQMVEMINDAERRAKPPHGLRPDARLFLVVNFHQMISRPLQLGNVLHEDQLLQVIHHDILLVIEDAANEGDQQVNDSPAATPSTDGISAAAILRALARKWKELKLNSIGAWRD